MSYDSDVHPSQHLNGEVEDYLYDIQLLNNLPWDESKHLFDPPISPTSPGQNIRVRPLSSLDYDKGFPNLLSQLTHVGDVSKKQFLDTFHEMKACKNTYFVTVIEDTSTNCIIGAATVQVEKKFIHSCALRGRVEDVVIDDAYRGRQLGKLIVETVKQLGKHFGCYKITLDCRDEMMKFYTQFGFVQEEGEANLMTIRYRN